MISVLWGACQLNSSPLSVNRFQTCRKRAVLPQGEWRSEVWRGGRAGLAAFHRSRETAAALVASPSVPGCRLIWNGTLFNRKELVAELRGEAELPETPQDGHLALAAYGRWGSRFPARLLGEFSLIVYDEPRRRFVAARDALGLRDLFYRHEADGLEVSSQTALLHPNGAPSLDQLDLEYVADLLATHIIAGPRTPFRSLRRLPPGHVLVVEDGEVAIEAYWELQGPRSIQYGREEEYAEGLRHHLFEAVERCLDPTKRVWSHLSGGLDSSSIASVAHLILTDKQELDRGFALMTRVWEESPDVDERDWSTPVAEALGRPWHQVPCDGLLFDGASEGSRFRDDPGFEILMHPMNARSVDLLEAHGVDAVLSGARAEAAILTERPPPLHLADLLRGLELRRFKKEFLAWQKVVHEPFANMLWRTCLGPLLNPRKVVHFLGREYKDLEWLAPEFARRFNLRERTHLGRMPLRHRLPTAQFHYELIGGSELMTCRGYQALCCEELHPFMYRPLVEYCFSIPWEEKVRPGVPKWLLRKAMAGILEESVRRRGNKLGPGPAIYRGFHDRWNDLLPLVRDPVLAELGIVDRDEFQRAAELARLGMSRRFAVFLGALALEIWVRTVFRCEGLPRTSA